MRIYNIILIILLLSFTCLSQTLEEKIEHDHITSSIERFELMRILPPGKITYYDGIKIEISISTKEVVLIKSFEISENSILSNDFKKNWREGLWWVIYCKQDNHLYTVSKVDPKQLK